MTDLPQRIAPDAILEGIIELRFEPSDLPEVFLGKLLTTPILRDLSPTRLPQADIPYSAREADPNLRVQPIYQLEAGNELIRIGTSTISFHVLQPYPGWNAFYRRAGEIIGGTWLAVGAPPLERCGLRYVNALTSDGHGINTIDDLSLAVIVKGQNLVDVTVSFLSSDAPHTETLVRVASVKHVQGDVPPNSTFAVDLDVRTTGDVSRWKDTDIMAWLAEARAVKNKHFFDLLPARIIETLQVE